MLETIQLHREGSLEVRNMIENHEKCGPHGISVYGFVCDIWIKAKDRDQYGFVCDTVQLAELFGKLFQPETPQPYVSCEEMAMLAVQAIKRRLVPKAKKIRVQISPMPDRWAAATKKW